MRDGYAVAYARLYARIMDAIQENPKYPNTVLLGNALRYMQEIGMAPGAE